MFLLRTWIVVLVMVAMFTASNMWSKPTAARPLTVVLPLVAATTSISDSDPLPPSIREGDWAEPRVDLNGNEIDAAIGDYRVDKRGEMYERHAPDTALLH